MNYFTKEKKAYKSKVKKVNKILKHEDVHLQGKGIPQPAKLDNSIVGVKKTKVFKKVFTK